jgi:putative membrane protein
MNMKIVAVAVITSILTACSPAVGQQAPGNGRIGDGYGYGQHMMWGGDYWGFGMLIGPLFTILILVAVFAAVVLLVRWIGGPGHGAMHHHFASPPPRAPLDILKERFAKGEIDKEEYEERRRVLGD